MEVINMKDRALKNTLGVIIGVPIILVAHICDAVSDVASLFRNINHDEIEEESE